METKIIDGNKIFANFMETKKEDELYKGKEVYLFPDKLNNGSPCRFIEDLKYHSSWDWLIPVYAKVKAKLLDIDKRAKDPFFRKIDDKEKFLQRINDLIWNIRYSIMEPCINDAWKNTLEAIVFNELYKNFDKEDSI